MPGVKRFRLNEIKVKLKNYSSSRKLKLEKLEEKFEYCVSIRKKLDILMKKLVKEMNRWMDVKMNAISRFNQIHTQYLLIELPVRQSIIIIIIIIKLN